MCSVLNIHRSGFYAWLKQPLSKTAQDNVRLLERIKASYVQSGAVYGSPRITHELRRQGESCGENCVAKLMRQAKLKANIGYKRLYFKSSVPAIAADNHLQQQFVVCEPDKAWVADITYIKTYEGWLYLAVVLDLFSRKVIGWSMQPTMTSDIVIKALLMAIWRRPAASEVIVHSDQGSQYASGDYRDFFKCS
jgi:putative transposase